MLGVKCSDPCHDSSATLSGSVVTFPSSPAIFPGFSAILCRFQLKKPRMIPE